MTVNSKELDATKFATLAALLDERARVEPERNAYALLANDAIGDSLSYGELHAQAARIAGAVARHTAPGDRVLILCPPGLDYIRAFFACLLCGRTAVPAYPPRNNRHFLRLAAILRDCQAAAILTHSEVRSNLSALADDPALAALPILAIDDDFSSESFSSIAASPNAIAFLQYTSGSTGTPKGVMVTHANIMANSAMSAEAFGLDSNTTIVSWLPLFHDMGLMCMLQAVYAGTRIIIMSPYEFATRPISWLSAVSEFGAAVSGGPNFAYDLCSSKISDTHCEGLDLSRWRIAFNGAEPIRAETLERFSRRFAKFGFQPRAHFPCYGLAEATLFVSGKTASPEPVILDLSQAALAQNEIKPGTGDDRKQLVSSGQPFHGAGVEIVDPNTARPCKSGEIGEVWITGAHVAAGYWQNPTQTKETFQARIPGDDRPYLRTGDLGFLDQGELFITGRQKDLIIVRGQNYYPQDIEQVAEASHENLVPSGGAAFMIPSTDAVESEHVIVVFEVHRTASQKPLEPVAAAIKDAVVEALGVPVHEVVLVMQHAIPKTSSGKIQRQQTRTRYLQTELQRVLYRSGSVESAAIDRSAKVRELMAAKGPEQTLTMLDDTVKNVISQVLEQPFILLDSRVPLGDYGLTPESAARIQELLKVEVGVELPCPSANGSIHELAEKLFALLRS
jgi:acyl-CoA synthetase (AMP-forming)/AMP-acid ligase II